MAKDKVEIPVVLDTTQIQTAADKIQDAFPNRVDIEAQPQLPRMPQQPQIRQEAIPQQQFQRIEHQKIEEIVKRREDINEITRERETSRQVEREVVRERSPQRESIVTDQRRRFAQKELRDTEQLHAMHRRTFARKQSILRTEASVDALRRRNLTRQRINLMTQGIREGMAERAYGLPMGGQQLAGAIRGGAGAGLLVGGGALLAFAGLSKAVISLERTLKEQEMRDVETARAVGTISPALIRAERQQEAMQAIRGAALSAAQAGGAEAQAQREAERLGLDVQRAVLRDAIDTEWQAFKDEMTAFYTEASNEAKTFWLKQEPFRWGPGRFFRMGPGDLNNFAPQWLLDRIEPYFPESMRRQNIQIPETQEPIDLIRQAIQQQQDLRIQRREERRITQGFQSQMEQPEDFYRRLAQSGLSRRADPTRLTEKILRDMLRELENIKANQQEQLKKEEEAAQQRERSAESVGRVMADSLMFGQ